VGFFPSFSVFLDFRLPILPSACQFSVSFPPFLSYLLGIVGSHQVGTHAGGKRLICGRKGIIKENGKKIGGNVFLFFSSCSKKNKNHKKQTVYLSGVFFCFFLSFPHFLGLGLMGNGISIMVFCSLFILLFFSLATELRSRYAWPGELKSGGPRRHMEGEDDNGGRRKARFGEVMHVGMG